MQIAITRRYNTVVTIKKGNLQLGFLQQQQQQQLQQQQEQQTTQPGIDKIAIAKNIPIPSICIPYVLPLSKISLSDSSPVKPFITSIKAFIYSGFSSSF